MQIVQTLKMKLGLLLLFLALATMQACYAQELDRMKGSYLQYAGAAKMSNPEAALAGMDKLWTEYLPKLLQETPSDYLALSQGCIDSALKVYASEVVLNLPPWNITFTLPEIIPILDATGKQGAGLLSGNVVLYGSYDECFSFNYTGFCLANQISLSANNGFPLPWTVGFCVPKNCTAQDLTLLINYTGLFEVQEDKVHCSNSIRPPYSTGAKVMLCVCALFAVLVVAGTLIDCSLTNVPKLLGKEEGEEEDFTEEEEEAKHHFVNDGGKSGKSPLINSRYVVNQAEFQNHKGKVNLSEFITAFSLFKTVPALLATKQASSVITSLNGLRVISMFWVILGHTFFSITVQFNGVDNYLHILEVGPRFSFGAIGSSFFSVDSFFFLSGVLVAYLTLRQMKKANGQFPLLKFYIHRILRLTPTYAFVLFFAWFLTNHLAYGPELNLSGESFAGNCERYWWTNFLYINNLFPWGLMDECVGWTWYLANDMQFHIISPLFLIPAYSVFPVAFIVAIVLVLSGAVVTGALTIVYDFQANMFAFYAYGYADKGTEMMTYSNAIYSKPWNRIAPYVVGLILGYVFYKRINFNKFNRIPRLLLYTAMWCLAGLIMFWLVYGLYFTWHGHTPRRFENILYITTSRFLWAVCLALVVFACHNGYGWFVNSFLSMSIWTPLSRMTFNAYLVHPIVVAVVYGQLQTTIHFTDTTIAGFFIMFVVLAYGTALVVCVAVEFPLGTIETLLFKLVGGFRCKPKNRKYVNLPNNHDGRNQTNQHVNA